MPRQKKNETEILNNKITSRFNESEMNEINFVSEIYKLKPSTYVRKIVLKQITETVVVAQPKEILELERKRLFLLSNLANNMNQIARRVNVNRGIDQKALSLLADIYATIRVFDNLVEDQKNEVFRKEESFDSSGGVS